MMFIFGMFIGAMAGFFCAALMNAARNNDGEN